MAMLRGELYYPYCGKLEGFCLSDNGCTKRKSAKKWCIYFRGTHPVTKQRPQSLWPLKEGVV